MALVPVMWLTFVFCNVMLWQPSCCPYQDKTVNRMKSKFNNLCRELVMDATMKIAAIQSYRREYGRSRAAQMGDLVYDMRSNYKKMTVIYQLAEEKNNSKEGCKDETKIVVKLYSLTQKASLVKSILNIIKHAEKSKETQEEMHERMMSMRSGKQREGAALRVLAARAPPNRVPGSRVPPPRALPARANKRQNQKWRHVVDADFV